MDLNPPIPDMDVNQPGQFILLTAVIPESLPSSFKSQLHALLNDEELERYNRFIFEHSRLEFLIGRATLRILLGHYLGQAPQDLVFELGKNGKPSLAGEFSNPEFNISHTRGMLAWAISSGGPIGVDVEIHEPDRAAHDIAERFFSREEVQRLARMSGEEFLRGFFQTWTLKEAYIKARGQGMTLPLGDFHILPGISAEDGFTIGFAREDLDPEPNQWKFVHRFIGESHSLGLAYCGASGGESLECRETDLSAWFRPE